MTSAEDREKEWWNRWWEEDWSWDGLAEKEWQNDLTLQDYWRDEENHLVKGPNGKHYTRAHTPLEWPAGTDLDDVDPPKNQWSEDDLQALADDLAARLENHRGTDDPARFDGTVLPIVPAMPPASQDPDAPLAQQPASLSAVHAWLQAGTKWSRKLFAKCNFRNASFSGNASFGNASFSGNASFGNASFSGDASFWNASFSGDAGFWNASFSGDADFWTASFSGIASFGSASFSGTASFGSASFSGFASFGSASFSGTASFGDASFSGSASFGNASFSGFASFGNASFSGNASFGDASFVPAFPKRTTNVSEQISALEKTRVTFNGATFEKMASFNVANLTSFANYSRRAFHGATFKGHLYTERNDGTDAPFAIGAFDGAQIERLIFLDSSQTTGDGRLPTFLREQLASTDTMEPEDREQNLRSIAEGARVLQIAMEKGRNREAEQYFHRVEMIARQKLRDTPWTPWPWGKPFPGQGDIQSRVTQLYDLTSNFGSSIVRPIASLLLVWLICTAIFFVGHIPSRAQSCDSLMPLRCDVPAIGTDLTAAAALSFKNVSRPFFIWSQSQTAATPFERRLLFSKKGDIGPGGFLVRVISTLQSFFSAVMLFLTILAARRYYQLG